MNLRTTEAVTIWDEDTSRTVMSALARSTPEVNFLPELEKCADVFTLPSDWNAVFNQAREIGKDQVPRVGIFGTDVNGKLIVGEEMLECGQPGEEIDALRWAELAPKIAYTQHLAAISGLYFVQQLQRWNKDGELFTPQTVYPLLNRQSKINSMLWVLPNENRMVMRTQRTDYTDKNLAEFEAERKARRDSELKALHTNTLMEADYKLAAYGGASGQPLTRLYPTRAVSRIRKM